MQGHGNDEIDAQLSEAGCVVLGPQPAQALADHLSASLLHCKNYISESTVIRTKPEDRFERISLVATPGATRRNVFVLANGAGTARAGEVRIRREGERTVVAEVVTGIGNEIATPDADRRVDKLSKSAREVEQHGLSIKECGELAYAASRLFSSCGDENVDRPFRRLQ